MSQRLLICCIKVLWIMLYLAPGFTGGFLTCNAPRLPSAGAFECPPAYATLRSAAKHERAGGYRRNFHRTFMHPLHEALLITGCITIIIICHKYLELVSKLSQ